MNKFNSIKNRLRKYRLKTKRAYQVMTRGLPYFSLIQFICGVQKKINRKWKSSKKTKKIIWIGYFPFHHRNMGDQAQTVAIEKFLKAHFSDYQLYCFDREEFGGKDWVKIEKEISRQDLILLSSTGDFGSRYVHQKKYAENRAWADVRRYIVQRFPENKIIQLPVTVYYGNGENDQHVIKMDQDAYAGADHFITLCREPISCGILEKLGIGRHAFFPDFVFYYKPRMQSFHRNGILLTLRDGDESALTENNKQYIRGLLGKQPLSVDEKDIMRVPFPVYESVREKYLEKICREMQKYQMLVTDRMHGMILAVITQTPCVVIDDAIPHKISGYESFLKGAVHFAHDIDALENVIEQALQAEYKKIELDKYYNEFREIFVK